MLTLNLKIFGKKYQLKVKGISESLASVQVTSQHLQTLKWLLFLMTAYLLLRTLATYTQIAHTTAFTSATDSTDFTTNIVSVK